MAEGRQGSRQGGGLRKALIRSTTRALLGVSAWLAREPARQAWSERWSRRLARAAIRRGGITTTTDAAALGAAWQRAFLSPRQVPLVRIDADTAYAEIRTPCPLRGSGDTHACHRMMAFDRHVAAAAGGRFVVLRSQAEPGVQVCEVALQVPAARTQLVAAHERALGGLA
jgi:hypothetical protein